MNNHRNEKETGHKEEYAMVLDVLLDSNNSFKDNELIQAVGTNVYTLLELVPKPGVILKTGDKVYIGEGKRDEVQYIKRAILASKLSSGARSELLFALIDIIKSREDEFINFFNKAGPITIRKHSLELVSGVGKKHLSELLEERYKPFENFEDVSKRCPYLPDPAKAVASRIIDELEGKDDFKFFTRR
jgi:putative nucleotide binding protein